MKTRQDAWSEEDDLLLAETVLRHVREGSTQLNAFEEVGDKLNRTASACGFRWNAVVRDQYEKALDLAKKQRKQRLRAMGQGKPAKKQLLYSPPMPTTITETSNMEFSSSYPTTVSEVAQNQSALSLEDVIQFLSSMNGNQYNQSIMRYENEALARENEMLKKQNEELERKAEQLDREFKTVEEDHQTLLQIMNRARKLVLFDEEERPATKFKMDRNGNLEKLAE
ncbi:RsfA family transcriptional regulator [Bacillus suaedaesalsae]|uniref:RsfA family transcriptional regulator n=1 Tax=Bacillus suaedaesalsae TaxID=2810349 RepID=A0ABS2DEB1_9BACI|nr:RsfA family transcriptional regulator [Bacillus suaedaesalsae]MBM6616806.1 RsfA family transcriptional regulator [Bacillus suaedaesalsae]